MTPPMFGHGELRLVLLTLIADRPRHGYELIQSLNDHFDGAYSPSAGTIYPRLAKLEAEGLVTKREDGRKTVYAITDAGQREVDERRAEFHRLTVSSPTTITSMAHTARVGLAEARANLVHELERIAADAREAATRAATAYQAAEPLEAGGGAPGADVRTSLPADAAEARRTEPTTPGAASSAADGEATGFGPGAHGADATAASRPTGARYFAAGVRGPAAPDTDEPHVAQYRQLDVALQRFRMDVRQDARRVDGELLTVGLLEEFEAELRTLRNSFAARIGVHR